MKKIFFVKCERCGRDKGRSSSKLCKSCAFKNRKISLETRENQSEKMKSDNEIIKQPTLTISELRGVLAELDISYYKDSRRNRTFFKLYPIIFKNISYYTQHYNSNFYSRIIAIIENFPVCMCGNPARWNNKSGEFETTQSCCKDVGLYKHTSKYHFMCKNGPVKGLVMFKKANPDKKGCRSLKWYKNKYGEYDGVTKYNDSYSWIFKKENPPFSKISQRLFDDIAKQIPENIKISNKLQYATNGYGEHRINFNKEEKKLIGESRVTMFVDFRLGSKIIEFDGSYWHKDSNNEDKIRDSILNKRGYEILRIKEKDYVENKIIEVNKCLKFLELQ